MNRRVSFQFSRSVDKCKYVAFLAGNIYKSMSYNTSWSVLWQIHLCVLNITKYQNGTETQLPWLGLMDYEHNLHHLLTDHIVVALYTCFSTHGCCRWIHSIMYFLPFVNYSVSNSALKIIGNMEFFNSRSNNIRWIIFCIKMSWRTSASTVGHDNLAFGTPGLSSSCWSVNRSVVLLLYFA